MPNTLVSKAAEESPRQERQTVALLPARAAVDEQQRHTPLRLLQQSNDARAAFPLPTLATGADVREVVQYLKKRPAGVPMMEAVGEMRRRVFEPRKVVAYELWGLVARRNDRLLLTPLGREFARRLAPGAEAFRTLLRGARAYHAALEWMGRQGTDTITHAEIVAFWRASFDDGRDVEEGHAVCFFHICQAAQIGAVTVGKRGQPSRLRVDREELADYLAGGGETGESPAETQTQARRQTTDEASDAPARTSCGGLKVFVSAGKSSALAAQVETTLALAGNTCEVFRRAEQTSLIPSEEAARLMRACDSAVLIISADDCRAGEGGEAAVVQSLLAQVAAAVVLYEGRVALLWESGLTQPASLEGLLSFTYTNDVLTWEVGIGLLKAAKEFQRRRRKG